MTILRDRKKVVIAGYGQGGIMAMKTGLEAMVNIGGVMSFNSFFTKTLIHPNTLSK